MQRRAAERQLRRDRRTAITNRLASVRALWRALRSCSRRFGNAVATRPRPIGNDVSHADRLFWRETSGRFGRLRTDERTAIIHFDLTLVVEEKSRAEIRHNRNDGRIRSYRSEYLPRRISRKCRFSNRRIALVRPHRRARAERRGRGPQRSFSCSHFLNANISFAFPGRQLTNLHEGNYDDGVRPTRSMDTIGTERRGCASRNVSNAPKKPTNAPFMRTEAAIARRHRIRSRESSTTFMRSPPTSPLDSERRKTTRGLRADDDTYLLEFRIVRTLHLHTGAFFEIEVVDDFFGDDFAR